MSVGAVLVVVVVVVVVVAAMMEVTMAAPLCLCSSTICRVAVSVSVMFPVRLRVK